MSEQEVDSASQQLEEIEEESEEELDDLLIQASQQFEEEDKFDNVKTSWIACYCKHHSSLRLPGQL